MLMAIIEYELDSDHAEEFLGLLGVLQPELERIDGFISADPAQSIKHTGVMYEISYWRDAGALAAWSGNALHEEAKRRGRERLLKWYRIRVGEVTRDWSVGAIPDGTPAAA